METLHSRSDAIAKIKAAPAGTEFLLRIRNDAPTVCGQCFRSALSGYTRVSRKEAALLVDCMLSQRLEDKGARMPIDIDGHNFWFGA